MGTVLRAQQLPLDLEWVSVVESRGDARARSPAGAAGLWQLTAQTARAYGLTVDRWIDERLDPVRSTRAAVQFLGDLYDLFGFWELALAGYNMGYGRLLGTIQRYNTNDFQALKRQAYALPRETTVYVSRIVALAIVGRNPGAFQLTDVRRDESNPIALTEVASGEGIAAIADRLGLDRKALVSLNPQLLKRQVPP